MSWKRSFGGEVSANPTKVGTDCLPLPPLGSRTLLSPPSYPTPTSRIFFFFNLEALETSDSAPEPPRSQPAGEDSEVEGGDFGF